MMGSVVRLSERKNRVRKGRGRQKPQEIIAPTAEQMGSGVFEIQDVTDKRNGGGTITIGKAYRRRPMIDVLAAAGLFSDKELKALHHYRHHADIADRSLIRDSLGKRVSAGGNHDWPTVAKLNAVRLVADVEAAAGTLRDILRAVVVYDQSLSEWAKQAAGAVEQRRERKGRVVCTLEPRRKALEIARLEIRMAAKRVEAVLAA